MQNKIIPIKIKKLYKQYYDDCIWLVEEIDNARNTHKLMLSELDYYSEEIDFFYYDFKNKKYSEVSEDFLEGFEYEEIFEDDPNGIMKDFEEIKNKIIVGEENGKI